MEEMPKLEFPGLFPCNNTVDTIACQRTTVSVSSKTSKGEVSAASVEE